MRIFLDANIIFSAARSDGAVRKLLTLLLADKHVLCVDEYVMNEARRNLSAKATPDALQFVDAMTTKLEISAARIGGANSPDTGWLPDKDRPVLAAAIRLHCDALVTGDITHFGAGFGKSFGGVVIYSPRLLADAALA